MMSEQVVELSMQVSESEQALAAKLVKCQECGQFVKFSWFINKWTRRLLLDKVDHALSLEKAFYFGKIDSAPLPDYPDKMVLEP